MRRLLGVWVSAVCVSVLLVVVVPSAGAAGDPLAGYRFCGSVDAPHMVGVLAKQRRDCSLAKQIASNWEASCLSVHAGRSCRFVGAGDLDYRCRHVSRGRGKEGVVAVCQTVAEVREGVRLRVARFGFVFDD